MSGLVAPSLLHPRFINPSSQSTSRSVTRPPDRPHPLLRLPTALPSGISGLPSRSTANSLTIQEAVEKLTNMSLDSTPPTQEMMPSLIRGYRATVPSSELPKQRRRMIRGGLVDEDFGYEKIGLKRLGDRARGLLTEQPEDALGSEASFGTAKKRRKRKTRSHDARRREGKLHLEDLVKQADEIAQDKENLHVRTVSPNLILLSLASVLMELVFNTRRDIRSVR